MDIGTAEPSMTYSTEQLEKYQEKLKFRKFLKEKYADKPKVVQTQQDVDFDCTAPKILLKTNNPERQYTKRERPRW